MDTSTVFLLMLILLLLIALSGHIIVVSRNNVVPQPVPVPVPSPPYHPMVGGCSGTRYGCCPNSSEAKVNTLGSNCYH